MTHSAPVVFDLDFTLWDCGGTWVDCTFGPYQAKGQDATDGQGRLMQLYPEVRGILDLCDAHGIPMALASRTDAPHLARQLLKALDIHHRFPYQEIYPGDKQAHLNKIAEDAGVPPPSLIFFDDEMRNIHSTRTMGVHAVHVPEGLNRSLFLSSWSESGRPSLED